MIAVAARGHEGLRAEIGGFGEVAAHQGDGAARVQRMTLDAVFATLPGLDPRDPLRAGIGAS